MPANTLTEMIMGLGIITCILLLYVLSLVLRYRRTKRDRESSDPTPD